MERYAAIKKRIGEEQGVEQKRALVFEWLLDELVSAEYQIESEWGLPGGRDVGDECRQQWWPRWNDPASIA